MSDLTQEQITQLQAEFKALQATLKEAGALPKAERKRERVTEYFDVQTAFIPVLDSQTVHIDKLFDLSKKADEKKHIGATWITFKPTDSKYGFAIINKQAEEAKRALREAEKAAKEKTEEDSTDKTEESENDEMSTETAEN